MSGTSQCTRTPVDPSIPFSILDLKAQAVRLPVSKGAQILLSELLTWSGERGYCWWSNESIARDLKWSTSSVWRRTSELQQACLLATIPRPGRSNYWVPLPGPAKMTRIRDELTPLAEPRAPLEKKKENAKAFRTFRTEEYVPTTPPAPTNDNASKILDLESRIIKLEQTVTTLDTTTAQPHVDPPNQAITTSRTPRANLSPEQRLLLQDIEEGCNDYHSRGCFINIIRKHPEEIIRAALSVTRETLSLVSGTNGGAYFQATLRGMLDGTVQDTNRSDTILPKEKISAPTICAEPEVSNKQPAEPELLPRTPTSSAKEPEPEEPEQLDPEALVKGWKVLYEPGDTSLVLSQIQRCIPDWEVRTTWESLRHERSTEAEASVLAEFLDLAAFKVQFQSTVGAAQ